MHLRTRVALGALLVVDLVVALLAGSTAVAAHRLERVSVAHPTDRPGDTWVIVGSDSRQHVPPSDRGVLGDAALVPGERADIVLVVQREGGRTTVLSVPRDLLVRDRRGSARVALMLRDGPQRVVDGLCSTLGVAADHVVVVDFNGFRSLIDAVGPIEVTIARPLRDREAGLVLERPGRQEIDADTALALVRSRQPEELVDGEWRPSGAGSERRADWAATVFAQVAERAADARTRPAAFVRAAWAASEAVTLDDETALGDVLGLAGGFDQVAVLQSEPVRDTLVRRLTAAGEEQLSDAGFGAACVPSP